MKAFAPLRLCAEFSSLLLSAVVSISTPAAAEPEYKTDEATGHRYRVAFDPASRVTLGIAGASTRGKGGKVLVTPEIEAGLAYRTTHASGMGKERVSWQIEHRVMSGWVEPWAGPRAGVPALDGAAYGIALLRHDESPSLVLPSSPPIGIPFPFDVGFDAEVGRASVTSLSATPVVRVGVVRAALLLDPLRSRARGRILAMGIGARYDVDITPGDTTRVTHRIAPMTAGSVRFRIESSDGLAVLDARAEVAPCWSTDRTWSTMARGSLHLERTLVALADKPLSAFLDGGARLDPSAIGASTWDFHAGLGLALHLSLP